VFGSHCATLFIAFTTILHRSGVVTASGKEPCATSDQLLRELQNATDGIKNATIQ